MSRSPKAHPPPVPVSMGSPRFETRRVPGFLVTDAWFPPDSVLPMHTHDRAVVAVCLQGHIESRISGRVLDGVESALWTEPAQDAHSNVTSTRGARVLALQPDWSRQDLLGPVAALLERPVRIANLETARAAGRLHRELEMSDEWSDFAVQAGALELLAEAGRAFDRALKSRRPPAWLGRVLELIHDRFRERLLLEQLAAEADVHPMHLARVFRRHLGKTVGQYQRELRLDWAEALLMTSGEPIGRIAIRAGFSDQSHFTRTFKRSRGTTPGRLREVARGVRAGERRGSP